MRVWTICGVFQPVLFFLSVYLAASGFCCSTWGLSLQRTGSNLRLMGLAAPWHVGS